MRKGKLVAIPKTEFKNGDLALDLFSQIVVIVDSEEKMHDADGGETQKGFLLRLERAGVRGNTFVRSREGLRIIAVEEREMLQKPITVENPDKDGELMEQMVEVEEITATELHPNYWLFAMMYALDKEEVPFTDHNGRAAIGSVANNFATALEILNKLPDHERLRFIADYSNRIEK